LTYSIIGLKEGLLGVGVVSGSIAVGNRVPWARPGIGGVITQAYTNPALGPMILSFLEEGYSAKRALSMAVSLDHGKVYRQVAVMSYSGEKAVFTGESVPKPSKGLVGKSCICIGNLLANEGVVDEMFKGFEEAEEKVLPYAILNALRRGHRAGGDSRGDRSGALIVVDDKSVILNVKIDYSEEPVSELYRKVESLYRPS